LDCPDAELSIVILDDAQMAKLNRDYRHKDGPTNVIAFAMRDGEFGDLNTDLLGDVVISLDTTRREALDEGISTHQRFNQLLVHGILHLLGYDHEISQVDAHRMEAKSQELMAMIGNGKG
jgi:probable rRNA maturation factor